MKKQDMERKKQEDSAFKRSGAVKRSHSLKRIRPKDSPEKEEQESEKIKISNIESMVIKVFENQDRQAEEWRLEMEKWRSTIKQDVADQMHAWKMEQDNERQKMREEWEELKREKEKWQSWKQEWSQKSREMEEKIDELENRSRWQNLVIKGIPEEEGETWLQTKKAVETLLQEKLKEKVDIVRAHRVGDYRREWCRPIVLKLEKEGDKDKILRVKSRLKGTLVFIE